MLLSSTSEFRFHNFYKCSTYQVEVLNSPCLGVRVSFLASEIHHSDYLVSRDIEENQQHHAYPQAEVETASDIGEPAASGCWRDGIFYLRLMERHRMWKTSCLRTPEIISLLNVLKHHRFFSTKKLFHLHVQEWWVPLVFLVQGREM